ncbi:MAG: ATP-binding protein [Victivallales bacterium]|nr:ATP-binding protein [Victivallales bacterium]
MAAENIRKYPDEFMDHNRMNRVMRHHLRNLCAGVKMTVERISAMTAAINPQIGSRCDIIINELDTLHRLTDRMDLLFDTLPGAKSRSLFELVAALRRSFAARFPFCALKLNGPETVLNLPYGSRLQLALEELLTNAGEAAGENGSVVMTWNTAAGELEFILENDGESFPAEIPTTPPIPFYTSRSRHDGLGLSIAYRIIVGTLNGDMVISPGAGTTRTTCSLPTAETTHE